MVVMNKLRNVGLAALAISTAALSPASAADENLNTYDFPNGLTVEPLPYSPSVLESLLDVKVWKFAVRVDNAQEMDLSCAVELREKNQPTKVLHTLDFASFAKAKQPTESEVTLALLPLTDGQIVDSLSRSKQMKLLLSNSALLPKPEADKNEQKVTVWFSSLSKSVATTVPNPYNGAISFGTPSYIFPHQGDIALWQGRVIENPVAGKTIQHDMVLYLACKATPHKDKKAE